MGEITYKREDISDLITPRVKGGKIFLPGTVITPAGRLTLPENCQGIAGSIPRISVVGDNLPEAWENAMLALYWAGCEIRTEYDRKDKNGSFCDPPSIDCSMNMTILNPLSEPIIHRCFPGGLDSLEEYRQEVIDGIKDFLIRDATDSDSTKWEYTYHERLFSYKVPGITEPINQVDKVIELLANSPITRRVEAITWQPWVDLGIGDPACLQRFWFRMLQDAEGIWNLNTNMDFRSRDAYKAAFMNDFAFIHLIKYIADGISAIREEPIKIAAFQDRSDSFHIYGEDLSTHEGLAGFEDVLIKQIRKRSFEDRTYTMEFAEPVFSEARPLIARKIEDMKKNYS